jgi:sec-independent protein translocase protein TatA
MFGDVGLPEILVILVIAVFVFGPTKLPALGRGLGDAIRNFKEGISEGSRREEREKQR